MLFFYVLLFSNTKLLAEARSLFLAAVGIGIIGYNKENRIEENFDDQKISSVSSLELDVSLEEFQDILNSKNSLEKAQGCCEGIKKSIQNGKGELYFNASDFLNTMVIKRTIQGNNFNYVSSNFHETQVFRIGYNYKF
jgi:hypothetical protein